MKKYSVFLILAVLLILLFSGSTSPLIDIVYSDYRTNAASTAIFIGKSWGEGFIPYKDLYVVEGPLFLFLQTLGWSLAKRTGIAILQILNLWIGLCVLYKIASKFGNKKTCLAAIIFGSAFFVGVMNGGNTSAELCFTLSVLGIYLVLDDLKNKEFVLGTLLGAMLMTDFTLGGVLYGITIYHSICQCREKKYKDLVRFVVLIGVGILLVVVPFVIYFINVDALSEFVNCVFVQNFKSIWLDIASIAFWAKQLIKTMPTLLLIVLSGLYYKKEKTYGILIATGVGMFFSLLLSQGYWHFLVIETIAVVLDMIVITKLFSGWKKNVIISVSFCICAFIAGWPMVSYMKFLNNSGLHAYDDLMNQIGELKEEENETLFLVNAPAFIYLETETMPSYYYFVQQREYSETDPSIQEKVTQYMIYECKDHLAVLQENGGTFLQIGEFSLLTSYSYDRTMLYLYQKGNAVHEH